MTKIRIAGHTEAIVIGDIEDIATHVFRRSEDAPLVLVWEDLSRVRLLAVLDGADGRLKLLERQNIGGMTQLRGMLDDHRFAVVSSRTTGNVTVEIYDFS